MSSLPEVRSDLCHKLKPAVVKQELQQQAKVVRMMDEGAFTSAFDSLTAGIKETQQSHQSSPVRNTSWHGSWRKRLAPEVIQSLDEMSGWLRDDADQCFRVTLPGGNILELADSIPATRCSVILFGVCWRLRVHCFESNPDGTNVVGLLHKCRRVGQNKQ